MLTYGWSSFRRIIISKEMAPTFPVTNPVYLRGSWIPDFLGLWLPDLGAQEEKGHSAPLAVAPIAGFTTCFRWRWCYCCYFCCLRKAEKSLDFCFIYLRYAKKPWSYDFSSFDYVRGHNHKLFFLGWRCLRYAENLWHVCFR